MDYLNRITSGVQARPMRNVIYGVEGVGKSTFASLFPIPVTIAAEDGTNHIDTNRMVPTDWNDIIGFLSFLYHNPEHGFKTLNIDTAGWVEEMCASHLCRVHEVESLEKIDKGYGRWKRYLTEEFSNMLNWCAALHGQGMHINFIAHTAVKKFNNPEDNDYDRYNIAMMNADLSERLKQWSDNVMFLNFDTMLEKPKKGDMGGKTKASSFNRRVLHAKRTAAYDAKTRMDLPDTLELGGNPQEGFDLFWSYFINWQGKDQPTQSQPAASS